MVTMNKAGIPARPMAKGGAGGRLGDIMTQDEAVNAFMAAAALIATSDGGISMEERYLVSQLVEASGFYGQTGNAFARFNQFAADLRDDPMAGREAVWKAVEPLAAEPKLARALVQVCLKVGRADGQVGFLEKQVVHELLDRLNMDPKSV
jgi:tellurite resistance protein TerB